MGVKPAELVLDLTGHCPSKRRCTPPMVHGWSFVKESNHGCGHLRRAEGLPMLDGAVVPLEVTEFQERAFSLSPDGRWLALCLQPFGTE